jgi:diguanylate cyclase (GGDEF)-like protein
MIAGTATPGVCVGRVATNQRRAGDGGGVGPANEVQPPVTLQHDAADSVDDVPAANESSDADDVGTTEIDASPMPAADLALLPVPVGSARPGLLMPPLPSGWSDPLTGVDGPRFWDRVVLNETARVRRYKRPVTVAFVEIGGLDRLARLWGFDVAERALVSCARTLAKEIRSSDHIARVDVARFAILLTETGEIPAINFVERARASCEAAIGAVALDSVRVGFGWASPPLKGDLGEAIEVATARLAAELRED